MPLIKTYTKDTSITGGEKLLGSDSGITKLFTLTDLNAYFRTAATSGNAWSNYWSIVDSKITLSDALNVTEGVNGLINTVVTVTATTWKTLASGTDVTLLAAPGSGKAYDVQGLLIYVDGGDEPFNTSADPYITGPWAHENNSLPRATVFNVTSTKILYKWLENGNNGQYVMQQNAPLKVTANSGTTTTGNGTLYFSITYKVVNTSPTMV